MPEMAKAINLCAKRKECKNLTRILFLFGSNTPKLASPLFFLICAVNTPQLAAEILYSLIYEEVVQNEFITIGTENWN